MTDGLEMTLDALVVGAPLDRADWSDVVRRSRRPHRRRALVFAVGLVLLTIVVVTPAFGVGSRLLGLFNGTPVPSSQLVSARDLWNLNFLEHGRFPSGLPPSKTEVRRIGSNRVRLLATRDGVTFYSLGIHSRQGYPCFGIGRAADPLHFIGGAECARDFPSKKLPVLDMTAFHSNGGLPIPRSSSGTCCVWMLRGFAVNAVRKIALIGQDGGIEAVTPVQDNIYIRTTQLPTTPIRAIVAFDEQGNRVYCKPVAERGCR